MGCCRQLILHFYYASLVLLLHCYYFDGCFGCLEQERAALLQFKHSVNWPNNPGLPSWVEEEEDDNDQARKSNNCCSWERVECNVTTGRVIKLSLSYTRGESKEDVMQFSWFINASLFLPFEELQHLDLSSNWINGWLENEGFERLSSLKRLKILKLSENQFNNSILPSLSSLQSLNELWLNENNLIIGPSLSQGFERLSKLKRLQALYLDSNSFGNDILSYLASFKSLKILTLQGNKLNGSTSSPGFEDLSELKKLEILELSWSNFSNSLLPSIGSLTSLKTLYLRGNYLNGQFPEGLCKLKNLQELDLNTNNFEGNLPTCLGNMSSLKTLDLSNNNFAGNISSSPITLLTSLECISLGYNNFDPTFPLISFANHSKLVELYLDNYSKFKIKTKSTQWLPTFQLHILTLSFCNFNYKPINAALGFLSTQHDLKIARITHTNLSGELPTWLLENNSRLQVLDFRNNSLTGFFRLPAYPLMSLVGMDISNNHIHGDLPANFGEILPKIRYLNLSTNSFAGKIPFTIGSMSDLDYLDLSSNNFSGEIPASLAIGCPRLRVLKLSNNNLYGQIFPSEEFNLTQLVSLRLNENHFIGRSIPIGISRCSYLQVFDVSKNQLSGAIPAWIGNLTGLRTLVMKENSLEGPIAHEFCGLANVEFLDLSENYLSGLIPPCQNLSSLQFLHLQGNRFKGSIPNAFLHSKSLVTMNIGYNGFSGEIPNWIGELANLKVFILKANNLSGPILRQLCQLNQIGIMDLSYNNFLGSIPPCFKNIAFGKIESIKYAFEPKNLFEEGIPSFFPHRNLLNGGRPYIVHSEEGEQEEVEFITKSTSNSYMGNILNLMSSLDLSHNSLTGEIPIEIGALSQIHALNLSHNQLSGRIPSDLSNLKQLESLDLSHNKLSGEIPKELVELNFLAVFSVAYNNLSGRTPEEKQQFGTFKESSYEGNPFLCGPPLRKNCNSFDKGNSIINENSDGIEDKYGINLVSFFGSFAASYVVCLIAFATVLYINPHWRRMWFDFIDTWIMFKFVFLT